jgi:hypothetical protein
MERTGYPTHMVDIPAPNLDDAGAALVKYVSG